MPSRPLHRENEYIVQGDTHTHGGVVLSGDPTKTWMGLAWSRLGDKAVCFKCKGVFEIAEGDPTFGVNGIPGALKGHKLTCGAELIPKQAGAYAQERASNPDKKYKYDEQFSLTGGDGKPLADTYYTAVLPSGEHIHGMTDEQGKTPRFYSDSAIDIKVYWGDEALAKQHELGDS